MNHNHNKAEQPQGAPSGVEGGRRPTGTPEGAGTTEVLPKATRRRYTAEYKRRIVEEAARCCQPGQVGALLRREGIYSSQLTGWRRQYEQGALQALNQNRGRRPTKTPASQELARLEREIARLKEDLRQAHLIIDVQKKISALLSPTPPESPEESPSR
jgi:transposase-like protein